MKVPSMDFRGQKIVNEDGTFSDVMQSFFNDLEIFLTKNIGDEGLVMPSQTTDNVDIIQNNVSIGPTEIETSTCEFGTLLYNEDTNKGMIALDDGSGNPIFKEIITT